MAATLPLSCKPLEANLAMKEQALAHLEEPPALVPRYRPSDELRQFLEDL